MPKSVRRTKKRVSKRSRKAPPSAKSSAIPGATYWFTFSLLGYTVNVFRVPSFQEGGQVGMYDPETNEIYIKSPLSSAAEEVDCLLHEILHAISRIGLPPSVRLNEEQVTLTSTILTDILLRNTNVRNLFFERLNNE